MIANVFFPNWNKYSVLYIYITDAESNQFKTKPNFQVRDMYICGIELSTQNIVCYCYLDFVRNIIYIIIIIKRELPIKYVL